MMTKRILLVHAWQSNQPVISHIRLLSLCCSHRRARRRSRGQDSQRMRPSIFTLTDAPPKSVTVHLPAICLSIYFFACSLHSFTHSLAINQRLLIAEEEAIQYKEQQRQGQSVSINVSGVEVCNCCCWLLDYTLAQESPRRRRQDMPFHEREFKVSTPLSSSTALVVFQNPICHSLCSSYRIATAALDTTTHHSEIIGICWWLLHFPIQQKVARERGRNAPILITKRKHRISCCAAKG